MFNPLLTIVEKTETSVTIEANGFMGITKMVLPMTEKDFVAAHNEWINGKTVQAAFPMLNKFQREFLLTGMTDDEQKGFFK